MKAAAARIGIVLLIAGMPSCKPQKPTQFLTTNTPVKPTLPKDENGIELPMPEIVRSKQVSIEGAGFKTVTVGNASGDYVLFCNRKASNCLTPIPAKDYYVFNSKTKWKFPGATSYVTLGWFQDWTVKCNQAENIALVPTDLGAPDDVGMYGLSSWRGADKK